MQSTNRLDSSQLTRFVETLFEDDQPHIFEAYSTHDSPIKSFKNAAEVATYIAHELKHHKNPILLAIYYPDMLGQVQITTIKLYPEKCAGAMWRQIIEGWGLIQIQLKGEYNGSIKCRIAVNTEKRASAWAQNNTQLGPPSLWNWKIVEKHARRLIRVLRVDA